MRLTADNLVSSLVDKKPLEARAIAMVLPGSPKSQCLLLVVVAALFVGVELLLAMRQYVWAEGRMKAIPSKEDKTNATDSLQGTSREEVLTELAVLF